MIYDQIGGSYASTRQTDAAWEAQIHAALGDARRVVNVGAGSGSYEPAGAELIAIEPSETMIRQRPDGSAPVVRAVAEQLPFADGAFTAAMAVLTTHHWTDAERGLRELARVAQHQVIVTWDPEWFAANFWLVRDYLPEVADHERELATMAAVNAHLAVRQVEPLLVARDCRDGFFGAYWAQPERYLDGEVRASMSGLALLDADVVARGVNALRRDLDSGAWARRNAQLSGLDRLDLGYRLIVAQGRA